MTMCIRTVHDITWAVMDMEDSMTEALEKADRLESYLREAEDSYSESRVLREMNEIDRALKDARSHNARVRKSINRKEQS